MLIGKVDASYTQRKVFQHLQEATGKIAMIEDLAKRADWRVQVANTPAVITCSDVMANEHPELVLAYMKAMVKVERWANENKHAAGAILNRQTFYLDAEDTYQGIKDVDMVPSLSAQNMHCIKIGKDFIFQHETELPGTRHHLRYVDVDRTDVNRENCCDGNEIHEVVDVMVQFQPRREH